MNLERSRGLLSPKPKSHLDVIRLVKTPLLESEVSRCLETLLKLDLVKKDTDGYFSVKNESITTGNRFSSLGVVDFHKQMIRKGMESLDLFSGSEREISSVSLGLSPENFTKAKQMIEDMRSKIMALSESDAEKKGVYQLNFQLFPL